ncbi:uncharacterized protein LOC135482041 [Liolophura sinensis]|uniref:uncharacterized protein LOC135482041 n=1 Tax=Liolophura sinensis TaxID=3198878 RepID=UPI0031592A05
MAGSGHVFWLIGLYVLTVVVYVVQLFLSIVNGISSIGIFKNSVGNVSDLFYLEITPAGWTFSIWGFIYTWQVLWLVYAITLICRRSKSGYLYVNPGVLSPWFLFCFTLSTLFVIAWLFVWDNLIVEAAFATLLGATLASHAALCFAHRRMENIKSDLVELSQRKDILLKRILVLNGVAFYNTWISIATCLNFAMLLAYTGWSPVPQGAASTAALGLLMAVIFMWFIFKNFLFERHLRFTYSPFIVLPVGLAGSLDRNWDRNNGNSLLTAMILAVVVVLFGISLTHTIVRQIRENKCSPRLVEDPESVSGK